MAKLNRELTSYEQVTYLGGSAVDSAQALAIAADGTVLVAGNTSSVNFPGTAAGAQPNTGGNGDGFVAALSADLRKLLAATYLGGSATDRAWAMTIGIDDRILVAGDTASANFPGTAGGAQPVRASGGDAFVASLDASLGTITQSTYLGGSNNDVAYAIARDAADNVFVAGTTGSTNFPGTAGGAQSVAAGGGDAFVARLSPSLRTLTQATYVGGAQLDVAYALALHRDGSVYLAGDTASANFPGTTGGAQPARGGGVDAFVVSLDASLSKLKQATYFGGLSDESGAALVLDGGGGVYLAGSTRSTALPATALGAQANPGGGGDAFAARFNDALDVLTQATYLGGSGLDQGFALALDGRGHVFVAGGTASFNFPSATGGAQPVAAGGGDIFVGKLTASLALVDLPAIEYFHAEWGHYFVTADSNEIGKLDAGVFAGWARTGQSFKVAPLDTRGVVPVCRFFSVSFAPRSSHFYTPYADECAQVKLNPDWQFEGEVFAVALPDTDGACPVRMLPLYRLYNDGQGGAPNHRYTTSFATRSDMLQQGWIPEGAGPLGVMGCVTE